MKLSDALEMANMSVYELAETVGCHYTHILRIVHGKRRPSPELAAKIERATGSRINRVELLYPSDAGQPQA